MTKILGFLLNLGYLKDAVKINDSTMHERACDGAYIEIPGHVNMVVSILYSILIIYTTY